MLVVRQGPTHFSPLTGVCVTGDVGIHIDRTFGLEEVPQALRYVGEDVPNPRWSWRSPEVRDHRARSAS
jgi:hypothetical protein